MLVVKVAALTNKTACQRLDIKDRREKPINEEGKLLPYLGTVTLNTNQVVNQCKQFNMKKLNLTIKKVVLALSVST